VQLLPLAVSFILIYYFVVLPQRRQLRQLQALRDNLQVGDGVVTTGGIYGTIARLHDNKLTVQLRVAENPPLKISVARVAIVGLADLPDD
jgi:preprotein translocase subunit YajC